MRGGGEIIPGLLLGRLDLKLGLDESETAFEMFTRAVVAHEEMVVARSVSGASFGHHHVVGRARGLFALRHGKADAGQRTSREQYRGKEGPTH
jgi:hypothetical protein